LESDAIVDVDVDADEEVVVSIVEMYSGADVCTVA
jgi:hypothetical protein